MKPNMMNHDTTRDEAGWGDLIELNRRDLRHTEVNGASAFNGAESAFAIGADAVATSLEDAYEACRLLTKDHARTFYLASHFLPKSKRNACYAIYAFCRYVDDLADDGAHLDGTEAEKTREVIASWRSDLKQVYGGTQLNEMRNSNHEQRRHAMPGGPTNSKDRVMTAWSDVLHRYQIPLRLPEMVIEGCMTDVAPRVQIESFQELRDYCVKVASSVGLMTARVFGYDDPEAESRAIDLGIAMQLTNIIRDVGEDAANNRIYLPLDDLRTFGVNTDDIVSGRVTPDFKQLLSYQIARARQYYRSADEGIRMLDPDSRMTVHLMSRNYRRILDAVERNDYDVFSHRAHPSLFRKLTSLPSAFWHSKVS